MTFFYFSLSFIFGLSIEVYFILFILGIPTYFFWRWIFKKYLKAKKWAGVATWAATLVTMPVFYLLVIQLFIVSLLYTPSKDFDKKQWQIDKEGRFEMAEDIIESRLLMNKDSNQVKEILGDPSRDIEPSPIETSTFSWNYNMGFGGGGLGFLFHNLVIEFKNNKVVSVQHIKIKD